jgi:hypothetical protein
MVAQVPPEFSARDELAPFRIVESVVLLVNATPPPTIAHEAPTPTAKEIPPC